MLGKIRSPHSLHFRGTLNSVVAERIVSVLHCRNDHDKIVELNMIVISIFKSVLNYFFYISRYLFT